MFATNEANGNRSTSKRPQHKSSGVPSKASEPKGHEAFLKALEAAGAVVSIEELDTDTILQGTIKHSDKFTISLKVTAPDGRYQVYVIFKHAIKKFWTAPENQPLEV